MLVIWIGVRWPTSKSYSAIDVVPPTTVDAGIGDEDQEPDTEEQLGDSNEVEHARHDGKYAEWDFFGSEEMNRKK